MKKIFIIMSVFVLFLASCGNNTNKSVPNTLRLASDSEFSTLHPHKTSTGVDFQNIGQYLQTLVTYDNLGKLTVGAAASWTISPDGLVYRFALQPDAKWSNGEALTAADFVFAWQLLSANDQADYAYFTHYIKNGKAITQKQSEPSTLGAKAIDPLTLEITLEKPVAYFLDVLAFPTMAPLNEKFYQTVGDAYGSSAATTLANGPFRLETFDPALEISFSKNPNYWDQENVSLTGVNMRVIKEAATQSLLFDDGSLDMILVDGELNDKYAGNPNIASDISPSIVYFYLSGTTASANDVLANKSFRLAISKAIDKSIITDSILKNGSQPLNSLIPENFGDFLGQTFRDLSPIPNTSNFDTGAALTMLAQAQLELGQQSLAFDLSFPDSALFKSIYENVKSQIETNLPAVTVNLVGVPANIYYKQVMQKQTPAGHGQWGVDYADIQSFFTLFKADTTYNYGNYRNATYEDAYALAESAGLATQPMQRALAYLPAEATLLEDGVFIPLYQRATKWIAADNVRGITLSPIMPARQYRFISVL
ncbi:MAG: peptide ABC transporter substrate-binding protein [Culicoidibacterales bacterium]